MVRPPRCNPIFEVRVETGGIKPAHIFLKNQPNRAFWARAAPRRCNPHLAAMRRGGTGAILKKEHMLPFDVHAQHLLEGRAGN